MELPAMAGDEAHHVTIMIPTRDRHRHLVRLLASLRRSGHLPAHGVEVLVVDNNPPGSSQAASVAALAAEYGASLTTGPGPKSAALNAAALQTNGDYLVFLDDDTTITDPAWLKHLIGQFDPEVGYVAGDVRARQTGTRAQQVWEAKGGLSKGDAAGELKPPSGRHTSHAWRLKRVAAGANCAIPRSVFTRIGGFCERLGPGTAVEAGETLEIVDRVLRAGYTARYTPTARVCHEHPASARELRAKLRSYARGDSALAIHLARAHGDLLAAAWAIGGHQVYRACNLVRAASGRYRLPADCAWASMVGSVEGVFIYVVARIRPEARGAAA
jgi:glycosyltransferase involved in cell wall biosynthesis